MIGKTLPSEMRAYRDETTGREVTQLTSTGLNYHFEFTTNSFVSGDREILYLHSDGTPNDPGVWELFRLDLTSGVRTQESDFAARFKKVNSFTKTPDGRAVVFRGDDDLWKLDTETHELTLLARAPVGYGIGSPDISFDGRYVAFSANRMPVMKRTYRSGENYDGFKDHFYAFKNSYLMLAKMDGTESQILFEDTHWMGHVQFAPDTNEYISYCHEGPWNYVQQRIYLFNTVTRHVSPCFPQEENDSVGHEFWTRDGLIFFDDRGRGHDGTITSDKTQAVTVNPDGPDDIPWVGFADKEGRVIRHLELPYYCNHYHANIDNTKLVADAVNDIVLIDISTSTPRLETLCRHDTSWRYQMVHCHPTFSWSNDRILFASDRDCEGYPQLYVVRP